jgi:D-aminoacyl-tRNA deacylase
MGENRVAVINSAQDEAGRNIRRHMEALLPARGSCSEGDGREAPSFGFHEVEGRLIHADGIDREYPSDLILFISRHTSREPSPVLTVHVTGNLAGADLGGKPRSLPPACPSFMQAVLKELRGRAPPGYSVSYEVTHHGPTELSTPSFFVEIGSTASEWGDPRAGRAVAESILSAKPCNAINLVGFGGNHYAARQTEIACTSRGAFGHMAHSREVGALDEEMVGMMRDRSRAVAAYIDRKALGPRDLSRIEGILEGLGLPLISEGEILSMGEMEMESYLAVRTLAGKAYPGARCHPHGLHTLGRPVLVGLDPVLLDEAAKADEEGFISRLGAMPVVHLSGSGKGVLPLFITDEKLKGSVIHGLINLCVKIIIERQDAAVEGDRLIIRRFRFDPGKALGLGVPKGPLFGRLKAGEEIDLDGRIITPSMVQTARVTEIHIPGLELYQ